MIISKHPSMPTDCVVYGLLIIPVEVFLRASISAASLNGRDTRM